MDELRAFMCDPAPSTSKVVKLRGGLTGGVRLTKENPQNKWDRREEHRHSVVMAGTDYAREIRDRETDMYVKNEENRKQYESISAGLESMDRLSSLTASMYNIVELTEEAMTEVYSKYSFQMKEDTNKLAINEYRQQILDSINSFQVTIIEGPTGCGKTTQVPQWILDHSYQTRKPCKIIVTQPRRIAAISISKRVAQERGWDVGGLVGYQVGLENKTTSDTRIHYVTTGILLQKLVAAKNMNEYTHIVLDEIHERGQEMDFLLLVVKKFLYTVSPGVKIILMSATFNIKTFSDYFITSTFVKVVKKDPMYTVKTFYLNHLQKFGSMILHLEPKNEPAIAPEMHHLVIKLLNAFEQIDRQEEDNVEECSHSVLVFLPGINEIEDLYNSLNDMNLREKLAGPDCKKHKWWVLPLHSTITADEQVRVFQKAPPGNRKIILATNIAESSITVPDIKYVVDFCLMKMLVADENTNFTSLQMNWASKTNCEQRAGRAGRVRDGRVYRLVPDKFYDNFEEESKPEILRCPLERLVLLAKMLEMGPPSDVLALAMDPPDMSNILRTILVLKEVGALKKTLNGEWCSSDGDITYLGRIMAKLPLDVRASKLIVLGHIYHCLDMSIIMAAAMSVKNVFSSPFRERLNAYNSRLTWADGSTSDLITFYNVYQVWHTLRMQQHFKQPGSNEYTWARRFYLQLRALRELDDLVRELKQRLSREGIDVPRSASPWDKHELDFVLKIIISGAVYPQYFVQISHDEGRERDAVRTLGGLDPRNTVYLRNFPDHQPGPVYASSIRNAVRAQVGEEPRVIFDKNSKKVYLNFQDALTSAGVKRNDNLNKNDPRIPGQVVLPVYKSIKARQLKMDIRIPLLPLEKAKALAEVLEIENLNFDMDKMVPRLPDIDDTYFPLTISQFNSVSEFWVQYDDESTRSELQQIQAILNKGSLLAHTSTVSVGQLFVAPYVDNNGTTMHRVRVLRRSGRDMLQVLYIDYGSIGQLNECNLHSLPAGLPQELPPLAMQCRLAEVSPSPLLNHHAEWTRNAFNYFQKLISRGQLYGKVYSVSRGVVAIELMANGGKLSVNKELINKEYALPCDENYDSKLNHDLRQTATELNMAQKRAYNKEQIEVAFYHMREINHSIGKECTSDVCLKGPFSPLETVVHNLMYASREKQVTIEWNSVNAVLLDTEPQQIYERLLVAADVGQNETSSKLTLRHTTLLPNLPGLPALIALLFCPTAELRRDSAGTRYVSTLCGLGSTDDGSPYFPEHDLLVNIDAELTIEDLSVINHMRYLMDFTMYRGQECEVPVADDDYDAQLAKTLREDFQRLFYKRRKHREPQTVENAWEWKSCPESDLLEINRPDMTTRSVIYPLHVPQELHPLSTDELLALKKDNDELKLLVSRTTMSSSAQVVCKLCGTLPMTSQAMRIHLYSNAHRDREEDFRMFDS